MAGLVEINGKPVRVHFDPVLDGRHKEHVWGELMAFQPFTDYRARMDPEILVGEIEIQAITWFGSRIGFVFLDASLSTVVRGKAVQLPGASFLRGGSVVILSILTCEGREFVPVVTQPRGTIGRLAYTELVAGMLDGSGNVKGKGAAELEEEAGIKIAEADLVDMTALAYGDSVPGVFSSPGASDEFIRHMLYRATVTREQLDSIRGRECGLREHGEIITVGVIPLADVWRRLPDEHTLSALLLYKELKAAGRL
ncbi:MAG: hypothetical protein Q7R83_01855 [bacterium]|nr:hypothetical protein [bacterium]